MRDGRAEEELDRREQEIHRKEESLKKISEHFSRHHGDTRPAVVLHSNRRVAHDMGMKVSAEIEAAEAEYSDWRFQIDKEYWDDGYGVPSDGEDPRGGSRALNHREAWKKLEEEQEPEKKRRVKTVPDEVTQRDYERIEASENG